MTNRPLLLLPGMSHCAHHLTLTRSLVTAVNGQAASDGQGPKADVPVTTTKQKFGDALSGAICNCFEYLLLEVGRGS